MNLNLPLSDVNVVVVTDVHSWVAGHVRHEPALDANYGDVLSFYERLTQAAHMEGKDLFFVMNGDFVDGTGLSTVPPDELLPILERMPWDAVNCGNHELYHEETVALMQTSGFIDHWNGNYLSSNTVMADTGQPLGSRFTYLEAKYSQTKILVFGFLFNFEGNCATIRVETVEETVQQSWFTQELEKGDYGAILVMGHMDYQDPLVDVIHKAIRRRVSANMPIQFINGHSHIRAFRVLDHMSTAFEAGRFLDTVGFTSFPVVDNRSVKSVGAKRNDSEAPLFDHVFIDGNKDSLAGALRTNNKDMETEDGVKLAHLIHNTQELMGLELILGCSGTTYDLEKPMTEPDSLWALYMNQVMPFNLHHNASKVYMQSTGALRYNLFRGEVNVDDLIAVSPFESPIYRIGDRLTGQELQRVLDALDVTKPGNTYSTLPNYAISTDNIVPHQLYDVFVSNFDVSVVHTQLEIQTGRSMAIEMLQEKGKNITTTSVWKDFVPANWPCSAESQHDWLVLESFWLSAMASGLVVAILFVRYCQRRTTSVGVAETMPLLATSVVKTTQTS